MMTLKMVRPEVIGELPAGTLDAVPENYWSSFYQGSTQADPSPELSSLAEQMAEITGILPGSADYTFHSSSVDRQESQRGIEWHIDRTPQFVTSNILPTQFLIGTLRMSRKIQREVKTKYEHYPLGFMDQLGRAVDTITPRQLARLGLKIWQAEPSQVVYMPGMSLHRSPNNPYNYPVDRRFLAFKSRTDNTY